MQYTGIIHAGKTILREVRRGRGGGRVLCACGSGKQAVCLREPRGSDGPPLRAHEGAHTKQPPPPPSKPTGGLPRLLPRLAALRHRRRPLRRPQLWRLRDAQGEPLDTLRPAGREGAVGERLFLSRRRRGGRVQSSGPATPAAEAAEAAEAPSLPPTHPQPPPPTHPSTSAATRRPPPQVAARLGCGALAGTTGQTVAYPFDVARRRLQVSGWQGARELHSDHGSVVAYRGMVDCFVRTVREEGLGALFKVRVSVMGACS